MVGPRKIKEVVREEGSFMGIKFPALDGVEVTVNSSKEVTTLVKTGEVILESSPNFKIELSFITYNNRREDVELSAKIKEATGLNFAPYQRAKGYYHFYTSNYTPPEAKLDIYQKLIKIAQEYVADKKDEVLDYSNDFKEDFKSELILENRDMMLMPYKAKDMEDMYLLVLKEKVGGSTYSFLARESFYRGYLNAKSEDKEEDVGVSASLSSVQKYYPNFKRKAAFFLVGPNSYSVVKTFVQAEVAKDSFYFQEQVKKAEKNLDTVRDLEYLEENIFGVSIEYVEDKGVYLFKGKGYKDGGSMSRRTMIGLWANNFIYAEKVDSSQVIGSKEFYVEDYNKIELSLLTNGSAKEGYLVPLSESHKLSTIKENVEREMKIWGREQVMIDVFKDVIFDHHWAYDYPVVYVTDEGSAYLCHTNRKKFSKEQDKMISTTFKGIELNKEEVHYFLNNHPFSHRIGEMSRNVSVLASSTIKSNNELSALTEKETKELFEVLLLHFDMKQDVKIFGKKKDIQKMKF